MCNRPLFWDICYPPTWDICSPLFWDICYPFIKSESVIMDVVMVDKVVEEDNKVMGEVNKKLVKEYNDFVVKILQRWKVQKISWR